MFKRNLFSYLQMSTFEKVRRNILRDMSLSKTHTAESWANIMLSNTGRLTDVHQQHKFWQWMSNPMESEDIPDSIIESMEHTRIETPEYTTVPMLDDEKETEVRMRNEYFRNGQGVHIRSTPISATESEPLLVGPESSASDEMKTAE